MDVTEAREQVVSKLQQLKPRTTTHADGSLHSAEYVAKQSRLSVETVRDLFELLTGRNGWGMDAQKLRDRIRISVLGTNAYGDPSDGRPFRKDELGTLAEKLDDRRKTYN